MLHEVEAPFPHAYENGGHFEGAAPGSGDCANCAALKTQPPSLREMALAAKALGLDYPAISEHSRRLTVAHGLDPLRLARQCEEKDDVLNTRPPAALRRLLKRTL